jgi:hypothetical protein
MNAKNFKPGWRRKKTGCGGENRSHKLQLAIRETQNVAFQDLYYADGAAPHSSAGENYYITRNRPVYAGGLAQNAATGALESRIINVEHNLSRLQTAHHHVVHGAGKLAHEVCAPPPYSATSRRIKQKFYNSRD